MENEKEVVQERMSYYIVSKTGMILWKYHFWSVGDDDDDTDNLMGQYVSSLVNFVKQMKWAAPEERKGLIRWGKFDCRIINAEDTFLALQVHNGSIIGKEVGNVLDSFSEEVIDEFEEKYDEVLKDSICMGDTDQYNEFEQDFAHKIADEMEKIFQLYRKRLITEISYVEETPGFMVDAMKKQEANNLYKLFDGFARLNPRVYFAVDKVNNEFHSLCQIFKVPIYKPPREYRPTMPKMNSSPANINWDNLPEIRGDPLEKYKKK